MGGSDGASSELAVTALANMCMAVYLTVVLYLHREESGLWRAGAGDNCASLAGRGHLWFWRAWSDGAPLLLPDCVMAYVCAYLCLRTELFVSTGQQDLAPPYIAN